MATKRTRAPRSEYGVSKIAERRMMQDARNGFFNCFSSEEGSFEYQMRQWYFFAGGYHFLTLGQKGELYRAYEAIRAEGKDPDDVFNYVLARWREFTVAANTIHQLAGNVPPAPDTTFLLRYVALAISIPIDEAEAG
ncbi:hypothetical protein PQR75_06525 [Paraburkholderia fungorum]|uniref:hypothetical protein n=1 Tax=Paraburkholderia fungorum TaxID=134537 RepID=UPI0038BB0C2E